NYIDLHENLLTSILRVQRNSDVFVTDAKTADDLYGKVTDAQLIGVPDNASQSNDVKLTYTVTRGSKVKYNVTLELQFISASNSWGVSDFGDTFAPTGPGVPDIQPTPTINPDATPSPTPVSSTGGGPLVLVGRRAGS